MSIDWITVIAQIANFLVLVWLLKRFLYRPILDGIDAREAEIANRMQEAVTAKQASMEVTAQYHEKVQALEVAQSQMTDTIAKSAHKQRDGLMAEARQQIEQERVALRSHLDQEARDFATRLAGAGTGALLSLMRKALVDLADETLEDRIAHRLVTKLTPTLAKMDRMATAAVVTSHAPLEPAAQDAFARALKADFPKIAVRFETSDTQSPGVVLHMGGAHVAWTVDSYVAGLAENVGARLVQDSGLKAAADAQ